MADPTFFQDVAVPAPDGASAPAAFITAAGAKRAARVSVMRRIASRFAAAQDAWRRTPALVTLHMAAT